MNSNDSRNSNIELYRIIVMILIVAHHYVVHSGIVTYIGNELGSAKSIILLILGCWGKTGINCFVLISGYYLCNKGITLRKWLKLYFEVFFYYVVIYFSFVISGYEVFSWKECINSILPIWDLSTGFISCYLVFFFFIPFVNMLINNMVEKQHLLLIVLCLGMYSIWGSIPYVNVSLNYVSWFAVIYVIGAYIRLYPKELYRKHSLWCILTIGSIIVSGLVIVVLSKIGINGTFFLADSNKALAVIVAVCSFIWVVNLPVRYNKLINIIGGSTFGVLIIHTSCDAMLKWLWIDVLKTPLMYETPYYFIHMTLSTIGVFASCCVIDIIRKQIVGLLSKYSNSVE